MDQEYKLPELLEKDEQKKLQDAFKTDMTSLSERFHELLVQALMHAQKHREPSMMVRLLTEIVQEDDNGMYRKGAIAWMTYFSPLRLSAKSIKFSGKDKDGKEQPFRLLEAGAKPYWKLVKQGEAILHPMYQDGPLSQINRAIKSFQAAVANTNEKGEPINPDKPFYDGKHRDQMLAFMVNVKQLEAVIPLDDTKEIRLAHNKQKKAAAKDEGKQAA